MVGALAGVKGGSINAGGSRIGFKMSFRSVSALSSVA